MICSQFRRSLFHFHKSFQRNFNMANMTHWADIEELQIPVPYGYIAAKGWGDPNSEPVLALHGWQDNAGTFDTLIPLLSSNLYIVALDAPGHGLSSHKPIGAFYHYMEMLLDIKRVIDHLKWNQFSIIGHSLGGTIAVLYASIFSDKVKNVVLLDIIKPASQTPEKIPSITRSAIDQFLDIEKKHSQAAPVYTREEATERLITAMFKEITPKSAEMLLKRALKPSGCGKGVVFSRDIRLRVGSELQKFSHRDLKCFLQNLKCNMLIIQGTQPSFFRSSTPEVLPEFLALYREVCKSFNIVKVDGNHFVHLNNPELVVPHVDNFFKMNCNSLCKI